MRLVSCAQAVVASNRMKKPVSIPRCRAGISDLRKPIVACACERRPEKHPDIYRAYSCFCPVFGVQSARWRLYGRMDTFHVADHTANEHRFGFDCFASTGLNALQTM